MKYNSWNLKLMKNQLLECKKSGCSFDYKRLQALLSNRSDMHESSSLSSRLIQDRDAIQHLNYFLPYIHDFYTWSKEKNKFRRNGFEELELSEDELVYFLNDFYSNLFPEWINDFNNIYKQARNNLKFSKSNSFTFTLPTLNYSYINIRRTGSVEDFFSLTHEYAHSIVDRKKFRNTYDYRYPFIEAIPLFVELVTKDSIIHDYEGLSQEVNEYLNLLIKLIEKYSMEIFREKDYLDVSNLHMDDRRLQRDLQEKLNINYKKTMAMINLSITEKLNYTIGFLTAIELYYLYLSDKEKCYYVVDNIINMENKKNYLKELESFDLNLNSNSHRLIKK